MNGRRLDELQTEIRGWIDQSTLRFHAQFNEANQIWVLKYFNPAFLAEFLRRKQLVISNSPGFTWGDGLYVTPLLNPYSTMIYGRIGVLGRLENTPVLRAYDATDRKGIELYQEWITYSTYLYRLLTTTIHAATPKRFSPLFSNRHHLLSSRPVQQELRFPLAGSLVCRFRLGRNAVARAQSKADVLFKNSRV